MHPAVAPTGQIERDVVYLLVRLLPFNRFNHLLTLGLGRILMKHIEMKNSLNSQLYFDSICSIAILVVTRVTAFLTGPFKMPRTFRIRAARDGDDR